MTTPAPSTDIRKTRTVRLRTAPAWLPEKWRKRTSRITLSFTPSAGERRLFRRRKMIPPSQWAEKNRVNTYGPLEGSRWDNTFMPHMRGIMDAHFFPSVRYTGNCKAPQTGSSAGAETLVGYIADMRPGPVLITYPDRDTTSKRSTDYLQPMFQKSPRLRPLMTGVADDMASLRIKLQVLLLYMGWAGSVTSLGNISAMYLFADEVDKWPKRAAKKEADTLDLFYERFRAFQYGGKCMLISTPSDREGYIWQYTVKTAQIVFVYCIPCPECGEYHRASHHYIDFAGERDPGKIERDDIARYVFPCCGFVGTDRARKRALNDGIWCALENVARDEDGQISLEHKKEDWQMPGRELFAYLKEEKPAKIAFHSPAIVSKLVPISEIAAAFLRGLSDPAKMHYFDNQIRAIAHVPYRQNRKEDIIRALKDDRPAGLVPGNNRVAALIAGVDTQKDSFKVVIRAFGWGLMQPSWKIMEGEVETFADLEKLIIHGEYRDSAGLYYPVHLAVIDTGGTSTETGYSRTTEVYNFARLHPGRIIAYKGASGRKNKPWAKTVIDHYPGTRVPIPGGLDLYVCDTHHYKDDLAGRLRRKKDAAGAFLLDGDTTEQYIHEMCAEYTDDRGMWQCPKNRANHFWDCEVMALVGADLRQLKYIPDPNGEAVSVAQKKEQKSEEGE